MLRRTTMRPLAFVVCSALAAALPAQQLKTVPSGMADVEAGSVFTYPFGRVDAKLQLLIDADQITLGVGVITGIGFRQNNVTASQVTAAYTKNYMVTVYQVPTAAANMVADPVTNIGSATGTVVFNGPLNIPAQAPTSILPAPFGLQIPFNQFLPFDGSLGNLLLLIESTDQGPVTGTFRLDSQTFRAANIEGVVGEIDGSGCVANGTSLLLATTATSAVLGSNLQQTLTTTGATAANFALLGLQRRDLDLSVFGMPGCWSRVDLFASQLAIGSPANVQWTIPLNPAFEGLPVFAQAFGLSTTGLLQDSVVSNAQAIRIGSNSNPVAHADSAFYVATSASWFRSGAGTFVVPVTELQGVFP